MKNELARNCRNCYNREAGNWYGYLSVSSQTHSEKSRLDFLSLRGKNYSQLESKKKTLKHRITNGLKEEYYEIRMYKTRNKRPCFFLAPLLNFPTCGKCFYLCPPFPGCFFSWMVSMIHGMMHQYTNSEKNAGIDMYICTSYLSLIHI